MQQHCIGSVEEGLRRAFEVGGPRIQDGQVEIGLEESQNAVGFDDDVLGSGQDLADSGHGFGETSLLGADPPGMGGAGGQETRAIGFAGAVSFFGHGPGVVGGGAVTGFAIGGADVVPMLRDLEGGPAEFGQGRDQAGDDAGFANAAGMAADDEDGHSALLQALISWLLA